MFGMIKKNHWVSLVVAGVIVLFLLLAFGFQIFLRSMTQKFLANRSDVQSVAATLTHFETWGHRIEAVGTLTAVQGIQLTPEVTGVVTSIPFASGAMVNKGDLLITIDDIQDRAALLSAQATLTLAQETFNRTKRLFGQGAVSQDKLDQATANLASAQADVCAKKNMVAKKNITAPFSGKLGIRQVNLGQYVAPGTTIVSLYTLDPIYIDFAVTEDMAGQLAMGQAITARIDALAGTFKGTIIGRNPQADITTHTVLFRAKIDNGKNTLFPGLFGHVVIDFGKKAKTLVVPKPAITYAPYGSMVYVLKPDINYKRKASDKGIDLIFVAEQTFVKTGQERDNLVEIIDGLQEGDLVVTAGQIKIKNNSHVFLSQDAEALSLPNPPLQDRT